MRYCFMPFRYLYVDWLGKVRLCPWLSGPPLGDLREQSLLELWNSSYANEIRESFVNGTMQFCRKDVCPHIMNNTLGNISAQSVRELTFDKPDRFCLAYDYQCNLICPSCRKEKFVPRDDYLDRLAAVYEKIQPYLNDMDFISICGHGDPFYSQHCMTVLENLRPVRKNARLMFETNGHFFTPKNWERIKHLAQCHISIILSVESLNPYTYSQLRCGGTLKNLLKNIHFMLKLRKEEAINHMEGIMVVQDLNFMEIPVFSDTLLDMGFDRIVLEPLYDWGTFTESEYLFKNLLNPEHPQHGALMELVDKALKNPKIKCFSGRTKRKPVFFSVLGSSRFSLANISADDVLSGDADADAMTAALFNKGYIFIVDDGMYIGMLQYPERLKMTSNAIYQKKVARDVCLDTSYHVIHCTDLERVFEEVEIFLAENRDAAQTVFPVCNKEGKLIAKLMYSIQKN